MKKTRNIIAKLTKQLRPQVVKSKKKYNRKREKRTKSDET